MRFGISRQHGSALARGAAVLAMGALMAGCSAANLTDGLTTSSTGTMGVAQTSQPYPGDRVPRPKEPIGMEMQNTAATWTPPTAPSSSSWSSYSVPSATSSTVSSAPLPPPAAPGQPASQPAPAVARQPELEQRETQVAALPRAPEPPRASSGGLSGNTYTVTAGDTLYSVSRKTGVSVDRLKQANSLSGDTIRVGQKLVIPGGSGTAITSAAPAPAKQPEPVKTAAVKAEPSAIKPAPSQVETPKASASTTAPVQSEPKTAAQEKPAEEQVASLPPQATGVDRLRWPVRGRVISGFGSGSDGRPNDGIDIAVPEGTAVHAAENGVVIYAGDGLKGFGNTILVRHEDGLVTVYGHTSEMKVKRGDTVRRGQEIALSGMTGDADRPKLHFEVRKGTSPVDPMTYLE
ncbi:M23 family metallopeptidase [Chelativorans sp. SCAU2101]|uniref:M23 family metallopeptidase n=1 Tax=Chelativorans petroleitrophicus TaxID=2975484 RepID=A0A9X3B035_9HYPH|nr:M23 family metallopeptidase [Chelativorans petroleitrophicus]MCT8990709.1 M23 family metallopeptidase [Chelativorans petroleitrophicus]